MTPRLFSRRYVLLAAVRESAQTGLDPSRLGYRRLWGFRFDSDDTADDRPQRVQRESGTTCPVLRLRATLRKGGFSEFRVFEAERSDSSSGRRIKAGRDCVDCGPTESPVRRNQSSRRRIDGRRTGYFGSRRNCRQ